MLHYFTLTFGTSGWGQVAAILLVTIIIRSVVLLITFPITLSQTRMSELQPKIAALQQKYPNIDTNVEDKQRFAQEQMKLYKENKVTPIFTNRFDDSSIHYIYLRLGSFTRLSYFNSRYCI